MMSLEPIFLDGTFITNETGTDVLSSIPSMSRTVNACPCGIWSITVPLRIAVTLLMLCSFDITMHLLLSLHHSEP